MSTAPSYISVEDLRKICPESYKALEEAVDRITEGEESTIFAFESDPESAWDLEDEQIDELLPYVQSVQDDFNNKSGGCTLELYVADDGEFLMVNRAFKISPELAQLEEKFNINFEPVWGRYMG